MNSIMHCIHTARNKCHVNMFQNINVMTRKTISLKIINNCCDKIRIKSHTQTED